VPQQFEVQFKLLEKDQAARKEFDLYLKDFEKEEL
jgi:hypothetical protein